MTQTKQTPLNSDESTDALQSGTGWLIGVGALSIVNALLFALNIDVYFPVGLGMAVLVEAFGKELVGVIPAAIMAILISSVFIALGYFARRMKNKWLYIAGIGLYCIDVLVLIGIMVLMQSGDLLIDLGFHAIALFSIVRGIRGFSSVQRKE